MGRPNTFSLALLVSAALTSFASAQPISEERPLLLSELVVELRSRPDVDMQAVAAKVSAAMQMAPSSGASAVTLSPQQRAQLGALVQGALAGDPAALRALDQFPGWNIPDIGKALKAELAQLGGQPGERSLPVSITEELGIPAADQSAPSTSMSSLGYGLFRGTVYDDEKTERYADSKRLAEILNRLSDHGTGWVLYKGKRARSPYGILSLLEADGHTVEAHDHRSIANFSALYYQAPGTSELREVVAPLWLDTRLPVPGTERTMLVPATHSEVVFTVRGPVVNADVAFYLGIDHAATFRPTASSRPSWTGSKVLRRWSGKDALRAASAAAWVRRNMTRLTGRGRLNELESKAYGQLGVCNDATALVEARMGHEATHWPLVRLPEIYRNNGYLTRVSDRVPYDTDPAVIPGKERVIHSLPWSPSEIPDLFPRLASDAKAVAATSESAGLVGSAALSH